MTYHGSLVVNSLIHFEQVGDDFDVFVHSLVSGR